MEKITTVLFDLDGTLIPFDQKEFIESYLYLIAKNLFQWDTTKIYL
ncbi:MAG: hypothetical protein V8S33_08015 [Intestinibacter bartlettii]